MTEFALQYKKNMTMCGIMCNKELCAQQENKMRDILLILWISKQNQNMLLVCRGCSMSLMGKAHPMNSNDLVTQGHIFEQPSKYTSIQSIQIKRNENK